MAPKFNSASRSHKILQEVALQSGERSIYDAWTSIFGSISNSSFRQRIYITNMVGKLASELDKAQLQMSLTNFSPDIYNPVYSTIHNALNIDVLSHPWRDCQRSLNEYSLNMLRLFSEILDEDGQPLSEPELKTYLDSLLNMCAEVTNSNLPDDIKRFILEQIDILIKAFREYTIRGGEAFGEAFTQAITKYGLNLELIREQKSNADFQKYWEQITNTWAWIKERTEDVEAIAVLYTGYNLAEQGAKLVAGLLSH